MINYQQIIEEVNQIKDWLKEVRRDFHRHPELSTQEIQTQKKIIDYLKKYHIPYQTFDRHYGVVGIIEGHSQGKTVALRGDMDALPLKDLKKVSYASTKEGIMHACGHDAHMTILLGAAAILSKRKDQIKGNIKLIFQPAEETIGGAKPMILDGVLENPKVEAIFGLHVSPEIKVGKIGIKYGHFCAASDTIKITITGSSTHGAYPHDGIDAITIAAQVITAIQTIVSRNIDPRESAVVTIGTIQGGTQGNIVAKEVYMKGTVRSLNADVRELVLKRLKTIIEETAKAMGGKGELEVEEGYPSLVNHHNMTNIVQENVIELFQEKNLQPIEKVSMGVEDFAYFLQEVQGCFYRLGTGNQGKNTIHPVHSNHFDIDEDALAIGVAMQVANCLRFLSV